MNVHFFRRKNSTRLVVGIVTVDQPLVVRRLYGAVFHTVFGEQVHHLGQVVGVRGQDHVLADGSECLERIGLRDDVELAADTLKQRLATWSAPQPRYPSGVLGKYARLVSSASMGAVTG